MAHFQAGCKPLAHTAYLNHYQTCYLRAHAMSIVFLTIRTAVPYAKCKL